MSDPVGLSTESQYYYDEYIYFQVPKGFQRVYRYLYSAIPKSIIIWHYTVYVRNSTRTRTAVKLVILVTCAHRSGRQIDWGPMAQRN